MVNKAKAISAKLLELNLKKQLEETSKKKLNGKKWDETEKLEEKNTKKRKVVDNTERNREKTGRNSKKQ